MPSGSDDRKRSRPAPLLRKRRGVSSAGSPADESGPSSALSPARSTGPLSGRPRGRSPVPSRDRSGVVPPSSAIPCARTVAGAVAGAGAGIPNGPAGDTPSASRRAGLIPAGIRRIERRSKLPPYWRNIAPFLHALPPEPGEAVEGGGADAGKRLPAVAPEDRPFYWQLVLSAKGIPYRFLAEKSGRKRQAGNAGAGGAKLYVPPVCEGTALGEIVSFEREKPAPPVPLPPDKGGVWAVGLFFFVLFFWHYLRWNMAGVWDFLPDTPEAWVRAAGLDVYRTKNVGEWYRTVTALTLHADAAHILGNIALGAVFLVPLCRRAGPGVALLLTVCAGVAGNAATLFFRPAASVSLGFSTAVFGAVGLLAAFMAVHGFRYSMDSARAVLAERRHGAAVSAVPAGAGSGPIGSGLGKGVAPRPVFSNRVASQRAVKSAAMQAMLPLGAGLGVLAMLGGSDAPGVSYLSHCTGLFCGIILGLVTTVCVPGMLQFTGKKDAAVQAAALTLCVALLVAAWLPVLAVWHRAM